MNDKALELLKELVEAGDKHHPSMPGSEFLDLFRQYHLIAIKAKKLLEEIDGTAN